MSEKLRKILLLVVCGLLAADCGITAALLRMPKILILLIVPVLLAVPVLRPAKPRGEEPEENEKNGEN